jgi:hypothetical protein
MLLLLHLLRLDRMECWCRLQSAAEKAIVKVPLLLALLLLRLSKQPTRTLLLLRCTEQASALLLRRSRGSAKEALGGLRSSCLLLL